MLLPMKSRFSFARRPLRGADVRMALALTLSTLVLACASEPKAPGPLAVDLVIARDLTFRVVTDSSVTIADQFGLVFTLAEELQPIYDDFAIDIPGSNGDDSFRSFRCLLPT